MTIKIPHTTLPQTFCESVINSYVILVQTTFVKKIYSLETWTFVGEMSITIQQTALHQILCESVINSNAILKDLRPRPHLSRSPGLKWLSWTFVGEMLIKIQQTTLHQIFCDFVINSDVIFKSFKGPDNILARMSSGLTLPMLRLISSNAQDSKNLWKPSKPCHVGTH